MSMAKHVVMCDQCGTSTDFKTGIMKWGIGGFDKQDNMHFCSPACVRAYWDHLPAEDQPRFSLRCDGFDE